MTKVPAINVLVSSERKILLEAMEDLGNARSSLQDIVNRIQEGSIQAYFNSQITQIYPDRVDFQSPAGIQSIPNDFVLAMTGYQPHFEMLESLEVAFRPDEFRTPVYNDQTMESNTPGVYLAGVVCGGLKTNKWFIENSRVHAPLIVNHIAENTKRTSEVPG